MITVKQAKFQGVITRHWQPMYRKYMWSADGCGDNLYRDAFSATYAYNLKKAIFTLPALTQKEVDNELAVESRMVRAEAR